jgi:hypothetical protein
VDSHVFSVSAGLDWTQSWFSTVNHRYRRWDGESGPAKDSSRYFGIGYRFRNPVRIEVKDILEIRGSRFASQGKPAMIAAEIRKGDRILKLRDENGIPAWSGGGRRPSK